MSRRTLCLIFAALAISYLCYERVDHNPYGRYFAEVLDQVDRNYVEKVDDQRLFETAVDRLVHQLDPYSSFIGQSKAARFHESLGQKFGGIGIEVSLDPDSKQLTVMSPLVGTPAYAAGVRTGDKILAVDGTSTTGFSLDDAVKLLRGRPGDPVVIRVLHDGQSAPTDYQIKRSEIKVDSVLGDTRLPDGSWNFLLPGRDRLGYLRITSFGDRTVGELTSALGWLHEHDCQGLIIDLRNDPGGLLDAAKEACDLFLDKGDLIVSTRRRRAPEEQFRASGRGPYPRLPLVVLVNHYSASASEIMAACLQDHDRAAVVGERSWGKGSVQNVIPIEGGRSILTLTTASYWRPSGKNIHRRENSKPTDVWGVSPNPGCEVKMSEDEFATWIEARRKHDVVAAKKRHSSEKPDMNRADAKAPDAKAPDAAEAKPDGAAQPGDDPQSVDPQLKKAIEVLEAKIAE